MVFDLFVLLLTYEVASSLTLACPFISQKFVAFLAAALEGAHCVPAEVIAAAVVLQAFINVCKRKTKKTHKATRPV